MARPTLASTLRMAADVANNLDKFLDGITGLHGPIDAAIKENIWAAVQRRRSALNWERSTQKCYWRPHRTAKL
jgi:hypothetical protein